MNQPVAKCSAVALVVEDEPQVRRLLRVNLEANGYEVFDAANGRDGIAQAAQCRPEIILLDLGLPDWDGVEVLKRIREWSRVPVIILSVLDSENDKIAALDAGADDFVTKPFGSGELLARVRSTLRRSHPQPAEALFRNGNLEVDLSIRIIRKNGINVKLTPTEYALLRLLVVHVGKVLTHGQLLTEVWGPNAVEQTHYLRVHIAHLRKKLEDNASQPTFIITEPAVGYRAVRRDDFINRTVISGTSFAASGRLNCVKANTGL